MTKRKMKEEKKKQWQNKKDRTTDNTKTKMTKGHTIK
jgi:hypothetical protein